MKDYFWLGFAVILGAGCGFLVFTLLVALIDHIKHKVRWWLG